MSETVETYYIASARCRGQRTFTGEIRTEDDTEVWLGRYEGGYPTCSSKEQAHHFKSYEEAVEQAPKWDRCVWWWEFKPGSLRVFRVTERRVHERAEQEVPTP